MIKNPPVVSVLIATFNSEKYIEAALNSVFSQSYDNFEIVLVDDGSTDNTREIVSRYKDPRLRCFWEKHTSIPVVRNKLLSEARGVFLTFLDGDDIYFPEKIAKEKEFLEKRKEFAAVYCDIVYFYDNDLSKFYKHSFKHYSGNIFEPLLQNQFITNSAFMMRREVIDKVGFYDVNEIVEDWRYFIKMAKNGLLVGFIDENLVKFRIHIDNHTNFARQFLIQSSTVRLFHDIYAKMDQIQRKKYGMKRILFKRKFRFSLICIGDNRLKELIILWKEAKEFFVVRYLMIFLFLLCFIIPASLRRRFMEFLWNANKKRKFILIDKNDDAE